MWQNPAVQLPKHMVADTAKALSTQIQKRKMRVNVFDTPIAALKRHAGAPRTERTGACGRSRSIDCHVAHREGWRT